jgi:hypothetical protein
MTRTRTACVLVLICMLVPLGCGPSLRRESVSGTVTYKKKPIVIGSVTFVPIPETGQTFANAEIRDGKFSLSAADGPVAGKYRLRFVGYDKIVQGPLVPGEGPTPEPPKEVVPVKHGAKSTYEVEVKAGEPNVYTIDLD